MEKDLKKRKDMPSKNDDLPGYPLYSADDDIYNKEEKEPFDETEDSSLDEGLDVPGAELDDAEELIGEEDEENNYYSLGKEDQNDPDDDD